MSNNGHTGDPLGSSRDKSGEAWFQERVRAEEAKQRRRNGHYAGNGSAAPEPGDLRPYPTWDGASFLDAEFPQREDLLGRLIQERGLVMVYSVRGVGKTHFGLGCAAALASGGTFLRWTAPEPCKVLVVDGEMPALDLQKILREQLAGEHARRGWCENGRLLCSDTLPMDDSINLALGEHRARVERTLGDAKVLILDNRSTLVCGGRENDAESWDDMQAWFVRLRRRGVAIVLFEHAGRSGDHARGTSKREDVLDNVIHLKHPSDYEATEGCRFEVHVKKGRSLYGEDCTPFEASLEVRDGAALWTMTTVEHRQRDDAIAMHHAGSRPEGIAKELDVSVRTVQRWLREAGIDLKKGRPKKGGDDADDNVIRADFTGKGPRKPEE